MNFDGTGLVALTEGNGSHSVQYSPDRRFLIDTYSRVDMPPVHELRRVSDGGLVCKLETADASALKATGWQPPEVFVAKGRDGKTDIWGIICRPKDFDPNKKYPVIEQIYAGPQGSFVPKTFSAAGRFSFLTDLGFIVVQMDGMGTANRSKAFHDVCWHDLKDAGFPDRILWHQAVGKKYPYYDLDRVGIYGTSAGGQNATGGVLFHPEFYKVAASACGCHDNRMDKASWNEQWMGYPVGPWYAASSNIDNAHRLAGQAAPDRRRDGYERPARIDDAAGRRPDQGRQGLRSRRRSQRQPRHGRRLRPAPAARLLRSPPARQRAEVSGDRPDRPSRRRRSRRREPPDDSGAHRAATRVVERVARPGRDEQRPQRASRRDRALHHRPGQPAAIASAVGLAPARRADCASSPSSGSTSSATSTSTA